MLKLDEIYDALEESIKLQSHYAYLLNMYDSGQRMQFKNAMEWIERLREVDKQRKKEKDEARKTHP